MKSLRSTGSVQAARACFRYARTEIGAQYPLARAGLLDLGDHGGLACGNFCTDAACEIARRYSLLRLGTNDCERLGGNGGDHFLRLDREDFIEYVGHAAPAFEKGAHFNRWKKQW